MYALHAALVSLALTAPLAAQDEKVVSRVVGATEIVRVEQTVSVDFGGGSLAEYVDALRAVSENANILLPVEAQEVQLPAMELREVSLDAALDAATDMVEEPWDVNVRPRSGKQGNRLYTVRVKVRRGGNMVQFGPESMVVVFSLRGLTEKLPGDPEVAGMTVSPEIILTAVETGLAISDERQKAVIRYHPDSGLLFVRGSQSQNNTVQQVLRSMEKDLERHRDAARTRALLDDLGEKADPKAKKSTVR